MHLVQEILEFSGLEARQTVLRRLPVDLRAIIDDVASWAVPLAESQGLAITLAVDDGVPATGLGDTRRITQVVTNLVQNAIAYTEHGSVDVRVSGRPCSADGPGVGSWVDFRVRDTGIGIADEDLRTLFDPFVQADPQSAGDRLGVGLGLADLPRAGRPDERSPRRRVHPRRGQHLHLRPAAAARLTRQSLSAVTAASASTRAAMPVAASSMRRLPWWRSYVGPPGVRVPRRAIAPGTESRYHPKSSPPRLCGGGHVAVRAQDVLDRGAEQPRWTPAWLTTGGTPRW